MRIEGDCTEKGLFLTCHFVAPGQTKLETISFQVDTGSRPTLISEKDAKKIGLEYGKLKTSPKAIYGLGGKIRPYTLRNVVFVFDSDEGMQEIPLGSVEAVRYEGRRKDIKEQMMDIPSLLGWDFFWKKNLKIEIDCAKEKFYVMES